MPGPITESMVIEMASMEPWPDDATLYQPYEVEQILLPDNSTCLAVQAYLKMCRLDYNVEMRSNAEQMSPSGRVPFIKCGKFVISEFDPIVSFVKKKDQHLGSRLDNNQKCDMRAYMALVSNVLGHAELYLSWLDKTTYDEVTWPRYASFYPWPLNYTLTWMKKRQIMKRLKSLSWSDKTLDSVYNEVTMCCKALSERLGTSMYFFGNSPSELDALVFGHLFSILTTPLPDNHLATIIRGYQNLVDLCQRIEKEYFEGSEPEMIG